MASLQRCYVVLAICLWGTTKTLIVSASPTPQMEEEGDALVHDAYDDQSAVAKAEEESGEVDRFGNSAENAAEIAGEEMDAAWENDGDHFLVAEAIEEERLPAIKGDKGLTPWRGPFKLLPSARITCVIIGRATLTGSDDQCKQNAVGTYTEHVIRVPRGGDVRKRCNEAKWKAKFALRSQIPDACGTYVTSSLPCRYLNC